MFLTLSLQLCMSSFPVPKHTPYQRPMLSCSYEADAKKLFLDIKFGILISKALGYIWMRNHSSLGLRVCVCLGFLQS